MKYTIRLLQSQARSLDEIAEFEDKDNLAESATQHREYAKELRDAAGILDNVDRYRKSRHRI